MLAWLSCYQQNSQIYQLVVWTIQFLYFDRLLWRFVHCSMTKLWIYCTLKFYIIRALTVCGWRWPYLRILWHHLRGTQSFTDVSQIKTELNVIMFACEYRKHVWNTRMINMLAPRWQIRVRHRGRIFIKCRYIVFVNSDTVGLTTVRASIYFEFKVIRQFRQGWKTIKDCGEFKPHTISHSWPAFTKK